jgi:hypothetical protein
MRHDAQYLVKRFAPTMGRPEMGRRVSVACNAYTLDEALAAIPQLRRFGAVAFWIERRGQPATAIAQARSAYAAHRRR